MRFDYHFTAQCNMRDVKVYMSKTENLLVLSSLTGVPDQLVYIVILFCPLYGSVPSGNALIEVARISICNLQFLITHRL